MKKKRMPSTRIRFSLDQKIRKGEVYIWIDVWTINSRKGRSAIDNLRKAFADDSKHFNEKDRNIGTCIKAILSEFPKTPKIGKVSFRERYYYGSDTCHFRIEVPT
jgi:hypothetical protein